MLLFPERSKGASSGKATQATKGRGAQHNGEKHKKGSLEAPRLEPLGERLPYK